MFKSKKVDDVESVDSVEKVGAGKKTLGLMAYIVLVIGAITMIVNFIIGETSDAGKVTEWYQLVPVILETIVGLLTYTVFTIVSFPFVKGKKKTAEDEPVSEPVSDDGKKKKKKLPVKKIIYWVSVLVAYAFVLVPFIVDVVEYAKAVQGN